MVKQYIDTFYAETGVSGQGCSRQLGFFSVTALSEGGVNMNAYMQDKYIIFDYQGKKEYFLSPYRQQA